jgi:hypothetical protein
MYRRNHNRQKKTHIIFLCKKKRKRKRKRILELRYELPSRQIMRALNHDMKCGWVDAYLKDNTIRPRSELHCSDGKRKSRESETNFHPNSSRDFY